MIEITGLWLNESKDGKKYMVGYMGSAKLLVFRNDHKESEKQPDYRLFVVAKDLPDSNGGDDPFGEPSENPNDIKF